MAWRSSGRTNTALVENLWSNGLIRSPLVKAAFLSVDRAHYAPASPYEDSPQSIGHAATISAPHMHAAAVEALLEYVTEGVKERPRRVLDIGSGSGYLTQVLAELVGEGGVVVGVEHIPELKEMGERNMGKSAEGRALLDSGRCRFRVGDGRKGWAEPAPAAGQPAVGGAADSKAGDKNNEGGWDAIHVGAAAVELHEELVKQLRAPGRMFIPVGETDGWDQYIWTVNKDKDGNVKKQRGFGVRYVPLTDPPKGKRVQEEL
ncbi:protein-L-isoaspartate O-methyltransferase-domain-containing protein [Pseudomassariella vexata]|uniref:protein-L-isoaspartate(D-aspartate) O-methyltransferase n=1 Tax=Pseudomassariella vexata TaxID=1141098 RepID=A0A1Y2E6C5_9PEZI|nr:protein-L-isoaspartate O-methyltransferase-domain-containing protein [Pseudomassariella vexata]ORY67101.1 protein-L-isoaspartate O-methyltransferase-domain-containing protein [Pseudomassariella vexata]